VSLSTTGSLEQDELTGLGLRYVQEEEDQVWWEDAEVYTLYESNTKRGNSAAQVDQRHDETRM
jgi:hypothetical protein